MIQAQFCCLINKFSKDQLKQTGKKSNFSCFEKISISPELKKKLTQFELEKQFPENKLNRHSTREKKLRQKES